MTNNDEIPIDVPHRWQVFQLTPPGGFEAGTDTRLGFYRLERESGEHLTGPVLVDVSNGDQAQAKILYGKTHLAHIEHPTDQERAALLEIFKQAAKELNDDERDGGLFDKEQARARAAAIIRLRLATLDLRNDWKEEGDADSD